MNSSGKHRVCGEFSTDRKGLIADLRRLGVSDGDVVMVHASLKAIGPVAGGPAEVASGLVDAVGPSGTILAYVSWDRSPYEETLNGAGLDDAAKAAWPAFDPADAGVYIGFGALNAYLVRLPGARRSGNPDASVVAVGAAAEELTADHPLTSGYGVGSPMEKLVGLGGKVLLLGAPPSTVTVLHYAEAIAPIAGKRRVSTEMPILDGDGNKVWRRVEDFDSNGILDCYAAEGEADAVERIARDYLALGRHKAGRVGRAACLLVDARDIVEYGVGWLTERHG